MKYIILLCVILLPTKSFAPPSNIPIDFKRVELNQLKQSELSTNNVRRYLELIGVKHSDKVIKQYALETGWGKSKVCKSHKNLFGFRNSKGYMKYSHWTASIDSYKRFQLKKYKGGDYYKFLVNVGYAEDSVYICKLKNIRV